MKKEKLHKGEKTRQKILDAAIDLISDKGPDAVSMREISMRLKITKPVLYYYFRNKEDLMRQAFESATGKLKDLESRFSPANASLEDTLTAIVSSHLHLFRANPRLAKCAMKIFASPKGSFLKQLSERMKHQNEIQLKTALNGFTKKGEISVHNIDIVHKMISGIISYFLIEFSNGHIRSFPSNLPGRLVKLICAGAKGMHSLILAALMATCAASNAYAGPLTLSIKDSIDLAFKNNTSVFSADETRRIYQERIKEYWGGVYPQLSASAQYNRYLEKPDPALLGPKTDNNYTGSIDLNQVLWAGGKVSTGIKMAKLFATSSEEQYQTAAGNVAKSVKKMYYSVLLSSAITDIQRESLALARQHLATIEAQYKQGLASDLTVLRQKVEVSNTEPALTQARNLYEEGLIEFKNLIGLDPEVTITMTEPLGCAAQGIRDINELYKTALLHRPEYRSAKAQSDIAREKITLERAGHYPYLSAFASKQFFGQADSGFPSGDQKSWSTIAGVRLSLPLFSGGATAARVRQAKFETAIADANTREAERRIKIEVKKAWLELTEASERLASQSEAVKTARKALDATELRFKSGLASQLELNDTALALNRSQTLYIQAMHDTCSANAELNWAVGENR